MIQSRAAWGGAVELGIMSEILEVQLVVHRRGGTIDPPINNTGNVAAPTLDLDYNGGHYNLILNPGMEMERFEAVSSLPRIEHGTPIAQVPQQGDAPRELKPDFAVVGSGYLEDVDYTVVLGDLPPPEQS